MKQKNKKNSIGRTDYLNASGELHLYWNLVFDSFGQTQQK